MPVTTQSSRNASAIEADCNSAITGSGSASPLVSISNASTSLRLAAICRSERLRSPCVAQQMHPLANSITEPDAPEISAASMPSSPNSLTMTPIFRPCLPERM
jgi:hypothetical protein